MNKIIILALLFCSIIPVQYLGAAANNDNSNLGKVKTDQQTISYSFTTLEQAITSTNALLNSTTEGENEGEFPHGSKDDLSSALASASAFHGTDTTQSRIDSVTSALYDACSIFETLVITEPVSIVDAKANKQTRYLHLNLKNQMDRSLLYGMQHATGYGVGWSDDDDRSDVKDVCGDFPAIYGEDLSHIIQEEEFISYKDDDRFRYRIISAYERGAVITISWHQRDPDNRHYYASRINNEKIVPQIIPGGIRHSDYKTRLRKASEFFKSLRGENGEAIPLIFRPYHEHRGTWFWWGDGHCSVAEYNQFWQFTVHYLQDSLNVHNLL